MSKAKLHITFGCCLIILCANARRVRGADENGGDAVHAAQARAYLERACYTRDEVDRWLSRKVVLYGEVYDPLVGWVLADRRYQDGIDRSICTYRYDPQTGARRMIMHADKPCRINTYGDSFTHCDQVNDGETWQEYLAAHLNEPIRNYGVGGFSVYQAFLRMTREEEKTPAPFIVFNIYDDDHFRNLHGWRTIRLGYTKDTRAGVSAPSMPYVEANAATGTFVEHANPTPTKESVYHLTDPDWAIKEFGNSLTLKIMVAYDNLKNGTPEKSYGTIGALAREHGIQMEVNSRDSLVEALDAIYNSAGLFASMRVVEKIEAYAREHHKKVLYVLSFGSPTIAKTIHDGRRFDQPFVDFMKAKRLPFVDMMEIHLADYAQFRIPPDDYFKRYFVGHYNPCGNQLQAMALRLPLAAMLEPKPETYNLDAGVYTNPEKLRFPGRALPIEKGN